MHPKTREALDRLPPEKRAAALAAIERDAVRRATPEGRAEEAEVIRRIEEEFPPLRLDPALAEALRGLAAERRRRGLSLADVARDSGLERSMVQKLETGRIANPTVATLRAYAAALEKRWTWSVGDIADAAPAGPG